MKGITIAEQCHVVNIIPPVDINGAGVSSGVFCMKNYAHATIILPLGVTGAASTVTLEECDNATPSNATAIAFNYYKEETAAGDTLGARTAATAAGFSTSTENSIMYVIELDASELSEGYPWVQLELSDPSSGTLVSAVAILSGARYQPAGAVTAIV